MKHFHGKGHGEHLSVEANEQGAIDSQVLQLKVLSCQPHGSASLHICLDGLSGPILGSGLN